MDRAARYWGSWMCLGRLIGFGESFWWRACFAIVGQSAREKYDLQLFYSHLGYARERAALLFIDILLFQSRRSPLAHSRDAHTQLHTFNVNLQLNSHSLHLSMFMIPRSTCICIRAIFKVPFNFNTSTTHNKLLARSLNLQNPSRFQFTKSLFLISPRELKPVAGFTINGATLA